MGNRVNSRWPSFGLAPLQRKLNACARVFLPPTIYRTFFFVANIYKELLEDILVYYTCTLYLNNYYSLCKVRASKRSYISLRIE